MQFQKLGTLGLMLLGVTFMGGCEKSSTTTPGGGATTPTEQASATPTPTPTATPTPTPAPTDLTILNWGPKEAKVGSPVNVQADGNSALVFTVKQIGGKCAVYFNDVEQPTVVNYKNNAISAALPASVFEKPCEITIQIKNKSGEEKSEPVVFKVTAPASESGAQATTATQSGAPQTTATESNTQATTTTDASAQAAPASESEVKTAAASESGEKSAAAAKAGAKAKAKRQRKASSEKN